MAINIRTKGQNGEREAINLVEGWALPVTSHLGVDNVVLKRNLAQTQDGGYDLVGLDWLALEVKRHENLQVSQWWKQAVKQAGPEQTPFLMYRQNRTAWKFRILITTAHYGPATNTTCGQLIADFSVDQAQRWFQHELFARLSKADVS